MSRPARWRNKWSQTQPKRLLVVQLADIGDLILSTPALAALRAGLPAAFITLLTTAHAAPIVEGTGLVDEVITFERGQLDSSRAFLKPANLRRILALRRGHYDAVVYFHHFTLRLGTFKFALIGFASGAERRSGLENGNGWFLNDRLNDGGFGAEHQAQYWLNLAGLLGAESQPRPALVAEEPYALPTTNTPCIVIHAGGGGYSLARRWSPEGFAAVADKLCRDGAQIIIVGSNNDDGERVLAAMSNESRDAAINLVGQTTLKQLASVIKQADVFIGAESGVMHLAAAVGTPTLAIFGPGNPDAWGPWNPNGQIAIVRSAPECSPCSYVEHGIGLREGCPARTCLHMVTSAQVYRAVQALLNGGIPMMTQPPQPYRFARRVQILGLPVDAITYDEWLDLIALWVKEKAQQPNAVRHGMARHVCTTNPEFMMMAQRDPNFRNILRRADLCVPDGMGLVWAARRLGQRLPQRVTGSDGLPIIAERAAQEGWRLFLLGAAPGIAEKAAEILSQRYPGLHIAGTYSGSPSPEEEAAIVERINTSGTDLLFVAYGAPEQDKWIARNLPRLDVAMAMGVGGAYDFIAGVVPRAPLWMRRAGLEWLFRLIRQPWRIKRMMRLPRFVIAVMLRGEKASSRV